jgi:drug/metabolite transporter (DMT)-like permease
MTIAVFLLVLFGAALHATWNALVKSGGDKTLSVTLVAGSAAFIAILVLPFIAAPAKASWPFLAASTAFQIGYYVLVARAYHVADMSETYPLMRGTAPLLVAIASVTILHEHLAPQAWLGVVILCVGILSMATGRRPGRGKGVALALLNALVIAGYTLIDGAGVRRSGAPAAYTLWVFLLTGLPLALWVVGTRGDAFRRYAIANWPTGLVGGVGTITSYGLALWAMTVAPVPVVAALRETSILFGVAISALILKERVSAVRIAGACIMAGGAIALRLA